MKFNYLSLLGVALMGLQQPVFAKRGTSTQSDESTQDISSGTNSQQPYCYTVPNGANYGGSDLNPTKSWLYQWIGTYYNGTIVCTLIDSCILSMLALTPYVRKSKSKSLKIPKFAATRVVFSRTLTMVF